MGNSNLNGHKFKCHVSDNPKCACGHHVEDAEHFLYYCPLFMVHRNTHLQKYLHVNFNTLLFGDHQLTKQENTDIFKSVHHFIASTKRFET